MRSRKKAWVTDGNDASVMTKYKYISSKKDLEEVVRLLDGSQAVAVDLEADSMFHYQEKVCLIQMAQNDHRWAIDPLMVKDLSPLAPLFADESVEKIFHGADYDVRSLYRDFKIRINNLFDTELACRFLGMAQSGLGHVLSERFQVQVDKKFQRKDWSKRPLPDEMLEYAMGDVAHLVELAGMLKKELKTARRYEWVKEECRLLSGVRPADRELQPFFLKFSGAGKLDRRSLAVLEALLVVRDEMAQKKDRPAFKIMGNHTLLQLALKKPASPLALKQMRVMSDRQIAMYADEVLKAIDDGMRLSATALPAYPRHNRPRLSTKQAKRMKALKACRETLAEKFALPPGLLFNNALIGAIAASNPSDTAQLTAIDGIRTWQVNALGDALLSVLNGNSSRGNPASSNPR